MRETRGQGRVQHPFFLFARAGTVLLNHLGLGIYILFFYLQIHGQWRKFSDEHCWQIPHGRWWRYYCSLGEQRRIVFSLSPHRMSSTASHTCAREVMFFGVLLAVRGLEK